MEVVTDKNIEISESEVKHVAQGSRTGGAASQKRIWEREVFLILALVFLCLFLFIFHLGPRPIWDIDEGMHASTSKDMVLSGDWVTPTFNGKSFYDKPVLHNWFVALSLLVFGFTEFAARFPAALLGLGCVMLTYLLGREMSSPKVGFVSGVILATNGEVIILSRTVVHDISLGFFVTLALLSFYMGFKNEKHRRCYVLLFYASSGFAVLAKGPLGVLLPVLIAGIFLLLQGKMRFLREMVSGWGILIFLAIAAPWYVLISLNNKDYAGYFFIHQNLMRFLSPRAQHHAPFYYYFPALLGGFFPWSCFLPLALYRSLRGGLRKMGEGTAFLMIWFVVVFVFFTMASSKLSTYLLPLFPAASLLVGLLWRDLLETPTLELRKGFLYPLGFCLGVSLLALLYIQVNPPIRYEYEYGVTMSHVNILCILAVAGFALSFFLLLHKNSKASFCTLAGMVMVVIYVIILMIIPSVDPYRSTKGFAQKLDRLVDPGEKFVFYRRMRESALFYTDRKAILLTTPQQLINCLDSSKRVYCVINRSYFKEIKELESRAHVIDREGHKLMISNQEESGS